VKLIFGSYNLSAGGFDGGRDDRLRSQLDMMAEVGADVWALQECKYWKDNGNAAWLLAERTLGMRAYIAQSSHHDCNLAVLVRHGSGIMVHAERHEEGPPYWHAIARVSADIDGIPITFASAHLAPSTPTLRQVEAEAFWLLAKDARQEALIVGADWNSVPANDPDPDITGIDPEHARRKLDRSAARTIEATGLTDVAALIGDLTPTVGHDSGLYYRCDGVRTNIATSAITAYRVIMETRPRSDHRPVVATFSLAG